MIGKLLLILGSISFIVVIGGATYEHLGIVPVWASAAPASLAMFQGEYGIATQRFWIDPSGDIASSRACTYCQLANGGKEFHFGDYRWICRHPHNHIYFLRS